MSLTALSSIYSLHFHSNMVPVLVTIVANLDIDLFEGAVSCTSNSQLTVIEVG